MNNKPPQGARHTGHTWLDDLSTALVITYKFIKGIKSMKAMGNSESFTVTNPKGPLGPKLK